MTQTIDADQFRERLRASMVTCKECGHKAHSLTKHLREAHNMTAGQYDKKYPRDVNPDARLFSPVLGELLKNLNRTPRESAEFEAQLPMYEGKGNIPDSVRALCAGVPRNPVIEGIAIPKADPDFFWDPERAPEMAAGIAMGANVFCSGPTGAGKTEIAYQMHAALGLPMVRINLNGDATRASLVGEMRASPAKGTYFHEGALIMAMRAGCTLLADEIDYAPPHVLAVMNSVLEGKRTVFVEETNETIVAKKGFMVIGTANTGGKGDMNGNYTGTEVLNTAFLDRFAVKISLDYLPAKVEVDMLSGRFPAYDKAKIEKLVKFAGEVRTSFKKGALSVTLSTRKLIDCIRLSQMLSMDKAVQLSLFNWLDDDDRKLVEELKKRVAL